MNREDIIRMAQEAGFVVDEKAQKHQPNCIFHTHHMVDELLERFAALVAAAEREACAKMCEDGVDTEHPTVEGHIMKNFGASSRLAAAIRARSNT